MKNKDMEAIVKTLKEIDNILVVTHKSLDGDSLGSALALCFALRKLGKSSNIFKEDIISPKLEFLLKNYSDMPLEPQFVISVDIPNTSLIPEKAPSRIDMCIDHHTTNNIAASQKLVIKTAAATGEIIFKIIEELQVPICKKIATYLYTAIATDTGCFKYSNTTAETHLIAANLIKAQIDYASINHKMFELESFKDYNLKKIVLFNMEFFYNGILAIAEISQNILKKLDMKLEEIDAKIASETIKIEGVKIGILLKEKEDGTKVSIRTTKLYSSIEIAKKWDGGGHEMAGGCFIKKPLAIAKQEIIKELGFILRETENGKN